MTRELKFKEKAQALANLLKHLETIKKTNITTSLLNEITIDKKIFNVKNGVERQ